MESHRVNLMNFNQSEKKFITFPVGTTIRKQIGKSLIHNKQV